eukprot:CAMPEP_0184292316 /NCGR_PEP_ID=MMETSP1049-20130417/4119_1 /TAXON_ID=77928 /ORGANISM="Proteomonas sulcata, Strain CCMP704" /LENGTH=144 /DNA_ID=CAMNT_0026600045 /DNA_START=668 /DNA_END=1102 /DNA_ORIENTATION=-
MKYLTSPDDMISLIKIDTEGWEPAVLRGMNQTITQRRVDLILFETGSTWEDGRAAYPTNLFTVVQYLSEVLPEPFECFYVGFRCLLPLSRSNWDPVYDYRKQHRNVICGRRKEYMLDLFRIYNHLDSRNPAPICYNPPTLLSGH